MSPIYFIDRKEDILVCDFYIGVVNVLPWVLPDHPMYGRTIKEVYRYLIQRYLKPQKAILDRVEEVLRVDTKDSPFAAIHLRGSDKIVEDRELQESNRRILTVADQLSPDMPIFLLTDDDNILHMMKERYGRRLSFQDCVRTNTNIGIHYSDSQDKIGLGIDVLVDVLVAKNAEIFIGNGRSNVSAILDVFREWEPNKCILVNNSQLLERNVFMYDDPAR